MTVGHLLADARRELGLSLDALASRTGLTVEVLRSIEATDLPRLPPRGSLRNALKAYAAAVRLDAGAVSDRYIASLPILVNSADAFTAFEPEADDEPQPGSSSLFEYEQAYNPRLRRTPAQQDADSAGPALLLRPHPDRGSQRLVARYPAGSSRLLAPSDGRAPRFPLAVVFLVSALAVVGGYLLSARGDWWTNDRSPRTGSRVAAGGSAPPRQEDPNVARAVAPNTPPQLPAPAANSIGGSTAERSETVAPNDSSDPSLRSRPVGEKATERTTGTRGSPATSVDPPVPSAVIIVPGSQPPARAATSSAAAAGQLSGSWNVIVHDEAMSPEADRNRVAYYLRLEQQGTQIGGNGYRVSEAGAEVSSSQQPVVVRGTLSGERLTLDFTGQDREHFILYRSDDGVFRGRFRRDGGARPAVSSVVTLSPRASPR